MNILNELLSLLEAKVTYTGDKDELDKLVDLLNQHNINFTSTGGDDLDVFFSTPAAKDSLNNEIKNKNIKVSLSISESRGFDHREAALKISKVTIPNISLYAKNERDNFYRLSKPGRMVKGWIETWKKDGVNVLSIENAKIVGQSDEYDITLQGPRIELVKIINKLTRYTGTDKEIINTISEK